MNLQMIDIEQIYPNPLQPRQNFDDEKLQELADSIKEGELLQPIVVRKNKVGYEIVCGERRYKAYQKLNEKKIPAIVRDIKDDTDALEKSLIENLQRDDLTSVERENAMGSLWDSGRYKTHRELAKKIGISENNVSVQIRIREDRKRINVPFIVSTSTIQETEGLKDEPRKKLLKQIEEEKIGTREVRDVVRKIKEFPELEQQLEILDLYEQKQEEDDSTFDEIVDKYREIAENKRPLELDIQQDTNELHFNVFKDKCEQFLWITPANIRKIKNEKYRKQSIALIHKVINHGNNLLIALNETEVLDE